MKIYFDEVLINENYYAGLTRTSKMFNDVLKLGSTLCETYQLEVDNLSYTDIPKLISIYEDDKLVKTLIIDSYKINDFTTSFQLTDYMIKFNFNYDASAIMTETKIVNDEEVKYTTLLNIFNDICSKVGIETDITDFNGSDIEVSWYDNSYTARNYLGFIAEMNGWNLYITADNKLAYMPLKQDEVKEIPFDDISSFKIGSKHIITRVLWDDGENFWEYGDETGETYYIDTANVYVINESYVEYLYNQIKGFEYYNFETNDCPLVDIKTGENIKFVNGDEVYITIAQLEKATYSGGKWFGGTKIDIETKEQQETEVVSTDEKIRGIKIILDRDANSITRLVQNVSNMASEISILKQTSGSVSTEIAQAIQKNTDEILSEINKTISTQTSTEIETWFTKTGIQGDLEQLRTDIENTDNLILNINSYIKQSLDTETYGYEGTIIQSDEPLSDTTKLWYKKSEPDEDDDGLYAYIDGAWTIINETYGQAYIELGKEGNQTTLKIYPKVIQFNTNGVKTAYISNNALYITESTILKRQQIGHWLTVEDSYGNLNTTWVDEISS